MFASCFSTKSNKSSGTRKNGTKRFSLFRSRSDSEESMSKSDERAFRGSYDGRRGSYDLMSKSPPPSRFTHSSSSLDLARKQHSTSPFAKKDSSRSYDESGSYRKRKSELGGSARSSVKDERGFLDRAFESAANIDDQLLEDKRSS